MQHLKLTIEVAMKKLNISQSELSRRLGKTRNYLAEIKRVGCTTDKQKELIAMINHVICGEVFKSDDQIIAELSERLSEEQDKNAELIAENHRLKRIIDDADEKYKSVNDDLVEQKKWGNHLWKKAESFEDLYREKHNQLNLAIGVIVLGLACLVVGCFL